MNATTDLWDVCCSFYFPRNIRLRSEKTRIQYRYAVEGFGRSLGRAATVGDLDDDLVTIWMGQMLDSGMSPYTVRERAGRILTLWTFLAKKRVVQLFPTVLRPAAPAPLPLAWNQDELRRLFEAACWQDGFVAGVPARLWWPTHFAWIWNTSERIGATLALTFDMLDLDRGIASLPAVIRKGHLKPAVYKLWPDVVEMLRRIMLPKRDLVFPWPMTEATYYGHFTRILKRAGLPVGRKHKAHAIRVSHATWTEVFGGDATKKLMHGDRATTERSYLDQRYLPQKDVPLFKPWEPLGEAG